MRAITDPESMDTLSPFFGTSRTASSVAEGETDLVRVEGSDADEYDFIRGY